ncbi:pyridoxal phosphate-dependent aminotransferase [Polynucleobacter sp. HIN8]|uniref:pyridoxal phosphate-dependent aminotransferase n=1 Tax=Polynucleobacter sp. HIN8 TaxID=3047867 RepID=UPI0025744C48|nr:pyridoxal phosphate-dependent aminotransferase [Polynucleobacter sp. HIN8]BEI38359.1 pyridoxal phosphate-dependent aminotransferase [Polynucleobacter sp. HIN8]
MPLPSIAASRLTGQKMFQILAQAQELERQGKEIIHFEIGEPDFNTPQNIIDNGIAALKSGNTHYVNSMGLLELRQEATLTTMRSRGFKPDVSQVLVTPGANIQIYLAIACTVNPGDEVIIPDPGFVSYESITNYVGATPVKVRLKEENDFRISPHDIKNAITKKTKLIIINSPSNPTGSVLRENEINEIFNLAKSHDIYILSDEIYARMIYGKDNKFVSPSRYDKCLEYSIIVNGFSKSYAMTGWRLGVVTGPSDVIRNMGLLLETTLSCTPPFIQIAGIAALRESQEEINSMVNTYERRRNILVNGLNGIRGFSCKLPQGAFYAFPNIVGTGLTSDKLSTLLMEELGIIVSPGTIFGKGGEGYIRFCYANSESNINKALYKMNKFFN